MCIYSERIFTPVDSDPLSYRDRGKSARSRLWVLGTFGINANARSENSILFGLEG